MATLVRNNFCVAPFTQVTLTPDGVASPCPEVARWSWKRPGTSINEIWNDPEFESLRDSFRQNIRDPRCDRCWNNEANGVQSLRRGLFIMPHLKEGLVEFINGDYVTGPRQMNIRTSNLCNLRCRSCSATASVTYNIEGQHYHKKNGLTDSWYISEATTPQFFSEQQINELYEFSGNLRRLEFYGGEPLLDDSTPMLLEKLVASGRSKNITLFYSTNCVTKPSERHFELWNQFKSIEFNFSIDAKEDKFTYLRHPGKWSDALENTARIRNMPWTIPTGFYGYCTVTSMNVYDLPETLAELERLGLPYVLNNAHGPAYYVIENLPMPVKSEILKHLDQFPEYEKPLAFVKNMLRSETVNDQWEKFKFWTHEKDEYRKESFKLTFPEYYEILNNYDKDF